MSKAYLLVICFLVASFTGCMGEDDDDNSASPVGVWYYKENMFLELKENGTTVVLMKPELGLPVVIPLPLHLRMK